MKAFRIDAVDPHLAARQLDHLAGAPRRGEEPELADGKRALVEDLQQLGADRAGRADDATEYSRM